VVVALHLRCRFSRWEKHIHVIEDDEEHKVLLAPQAPVRRVSIALLCGGGGWRIGRQRQERREYELKGWSRAGEVGVYIQVFVVGFACLMYGGYSMGNIAGK
jgi:hypothetical protein